MTTQEVTLPLPEPLYQRFQQLAQATHQSLTDVLLHAVEVGSPPDWQSAPAEFQAELAALDRLPDRALWQIARSRVTVAETARYQELLDKNSEGALTAEEQAELVGLRTDADRLMLRKAHAAALRRGRGHTLPAADKL